MRTYIFACIHNAGRSQISAALFNQLADASCARAISAGTQPADRVHPVVAEAMSECGIDLSGARPQLLTVELAHDAEMLITMGCGDACPYVPNLRRADWPLPDPKGRDLEFVRTQIEDIRARVLELLASERIPLAPTTPPGPMPHQPRAEHPGGPSAASFRDLLLGKTPLQ